MREVNMISSPNVNAHINIIHVTIGFIVTTSVLLLLIFGIRYLFALLVKNCNICDKIYVIYYYKNYNINYKIEIPVADVSIKQSHQKTIPQLFHKV